jgi:hypothetical protein
MWGRPRGRYRVEVFYRLNRNVSHLPGAGGGLDPVGDFHQPSLVREIANDARIIGDLPRANRFRGKARDVLAYRALRRDRNGAVCAQRELRELVIDALTAIWAARKFS